MPGVSGRCGLAGLAGRAGPRLSPLTSAQPQPRVVRADPVRSRRFRGRLDAEPDRDSSPLRVCHGPGPDGSPVGTRLDDRSIFAEYELCAIGQLDLVVLEAMAGSRLARLLVVSSHYAPLTGGLLAGFGFLTFGGRLGVLSPTDCLRSLCWMGRGRLNSGARRCPHWRV